MRAVSDPDDIDVTRRTVLAAERTWLAWWRRAAAMAVSVAVGGVVPELVKGDRWGYVAVGAYAARAGALIGAWLRQRQVRALARGGYVGVDPTWVFVLSVAAGLLALATRVVIIVAS